MEGYIGINIVCRLPDCFVFRFLGVFGINASDTSGFEDNESNNQSHVGETLINMMKQMRECSVTNFRVSPVMFDS